MAFPYVERLKAKVRPALVVSRDNSEYLPVAFITSRPLRADVEAALGLTPANPGFAPSGLRRASTIRLDRLATVTRDMLEARLGRLDAATMLRVNRALLFALDLHRDDPAADIS